MAPDVSSPSGMCPLCGAHTTPDANYCVACGQPLQPPQPRSALRSLAPMRIIEAEAPEEGDAPEAAEMALATQGEQGEQGVALAGRLASLAAVAWRQPVVRSAVTTGASAVALSLVWRVAGAALTGGKARRALLRELANEGAAPMVGQLLRDAAPGKRLRRRGRRGEIIEEVVYIRRVFRK